MNDPERDPWPSVDDELDDEDRCAYCEARDGEPHEPHCPLVDPAEDSMNFYQTAPEWTDGLQCEVCDLEIAPTDAVYADLDVATDTGVSRTVEHVGCHVSVDREKARIWREAAKYALHSGALELAVGFELRADRIHSRLTQHNERPRA